MSNRVERLRKYLLGSAIFLLLVIVAFIGVARYIRRQSVKMLPVRMALDVLREAANFQNCDTEGSKKKFCINAAKYIEYKDGKLVLHDASITLFGAKGDRSDRIYGDEFEYDKNAHIIRAPGIVHIDLQAAPPAGSSGQAASSARVMHITTSGLVYLQSLGLASTSEPVEFEAGGLTGHAVGADYSSDSALVSLHSAVSMSGTENGHALAMTAATAAFNDRSQQALLTRATYESEGRKASADQATLYRRPDGTLSRIDTKGNATLQANGGTAVAAHADVALTAASQPQTAVMTGGVKYSLDQPLRQVSGQADTATVQFDAQKQTQPEHATFAGTVHVTERTRATTAASEPWSTRELKAGRVEVALARDEAGKAEVQDVVATGSPHVTATNNGNVSGSAKKGTTDLSADTLTAHLAASGNATQPPQIETIAGRGSTVLHQLAADGKEQTVSADSLDARLRPRAPATSAAGTAKDKIAQSLLSAVQIGHVQMMQRTPAKVGTAAGAGATGDDIEHALADHSVYDGDTDRLTLSGGVQLSDATSELWASQVILDHKTGDSDATGGVKVSYTTEPSTGNVRNRNEPTHIVADRARHVHATDTATFFGAPARLWQGGNQIIAPVIELSNAQKTLIARGDAGAASTVVTTVLAGTGKPPVDAQAAPSPDGCPVDTSAKGATPSSPIARAVRVSSGGLTYSGTTGQADFTGGFRADTADGIIRADAGIVFVHLAQPAQNRNAGPSAQALPTASLEGDMDHVVATGRVELDKPGLKATGERLVYTASDRTALLTGDAKNPPRAVGPQGTTTGYALRLRRSCGGKGSGSVEVLAGPGQRAHTDATVNEEGKREKAKQ